MRFEFYTDKSVAQAMTAINERLHAKGSRLDGWVEKNGHFSLSVSEPVVGRIERRTRLDGIVERQSGVTVVKGSVPAGLPREKLPILMGALVVMTLVMLLSGKLLIGLVIVPAAAAMYIPLVGDHENSSVLVSEVQRTLKARTTPPKKTTAEARTAKPAPKAAIKKGKSVTQRNREAVKQRT